MLLYSIYTLNSIMGAQNSKKGKDVIWSGDQITLPRFPGSTSSNNQPSLTATIGGELNQCDTTCPSPVISSSPSQTTRIPARLTSKPSSLKLLRKFQPEMTCIQQEILALTKPTKKRRRSKRRSYQLASQTRKKRARSNTASSSLPDDDGTMCSTPSKRSTRNSKKRDTLNVIDWDFAVEDQISYLFNCFEKNGEPDLEEEVIDAIDPWIIPWGDQYPEQTIDRQFTQKILFEKMACLDPLEEKEFDLALKLDSAGKLWFLLELGRKKQFHLVNDDIFELTASERVELLAVPSIDLPLVDTPQSVSTGDSNLVQLDIGTAIIPSEDSHLVASGARLGDSVTGHSDSVHYSSDSSEEPVTDECNPEKAVIGITDGKNGEESESEVEESESEVEECDVYDLDEENPWKNVSRICQDPKEVGVEVPLVSAHSLSQSIIGASTVNVPIASSSHMVSLLPKDPRLNNNSISVCCKMSTVTNGQKGMEELPTCEEVDTVTLSESEEEVLIVEAPVISRFQRTMNSIFGLETPFPTLEILPGKDWVHDAAKGLEFVMTYSKEDKDSEEEFTRKVHQYSHDHKKGRFFC